MSVETAVRSTGPGAVFIHRDTSALKDDSTRSPSPCPSLGHSVSTIDPDSEAEDAMGNSLPILTVGLPISMEAKHHDRAIYSAGGPQEHPGHLDHDGSRPGEAGHADDTSAGKQGVSRGGDDKGGRKRRGDGDDDQPKGPASKLPGRTATSMNPREDEKRYACPYRKRNPVRYNIREYMRCSFQPFSNLARLKEHLKINHAPRSGHRDQCLATEGRDTCECFLAAPTSELEGHMSVEAMGKIIRIDSGPHNTEQSCWVAIYQILFGNSELVPEPGWQAPIELEEVVVEIHQNIGALREGIKLEAEKLIPHYQDVQVKVSSSMTHILIFFLERVLSSCQQRVRGNSSISLFDPQWRWSSMLPAPDQKDKTPHDLRGVGQWSQMFHYNLRPGPLPVNHDFHPPSSLVLTVRDGGQELFVRVDKQQIWAIQGLVQQSANREDEKNHKEENVSKEVGGDPPVTLELPPMDENHKEQDVPMEAGRDPEMTPERLPMDMSQSPTHSTSLSSCEEDSNSEEDMIDEVISRLCDIVLGYCGGLAAHGNFDVISQAVGSAVTDFVYELFSDLGNFPQVNQCPTDRGSPSTFSFGDGGCGESSGAGGSDLGGRGILGPGGGMRQRGAEENGPPGPGNGATEVGSRGTSLEFRYGCPYRKRNPARFSMKNGHVECVKSGWAVFSHLKRHILIKHRRLGESPYKCQRCEECFKSDALLQQHVKSPTSCALVESRKGENPEDGITPEVEKRLRSKAKGNIMCWKVLYRVLFPEDETIPSEEFEPVDETGRKIQERFQDAEPALRQKLESLIERDHIAPIMNAIQDHHEKVFAEYEKSLQGPGAGKGGKRLPSASQGDPQGASGKRRRVDEGTPSEALEPQFLPGGQILSGQTLEQGWVDVMQTAPAPQPQHQFDPDNAYLQRLGGGPMVHMPASSANYHHTEESVDFQGSNAAYDGLAGLENTWVNSSGTGPHLAGFELPQWMCDNQGDSGVPPMEGSDGSYDFGEPSHS